MGWLLERVEKSEGGCWVWRGAKDSKGYGLVARWPDGKKGKPLQIKAHRAAWIAANGHEGLDGMCAHLFLGTKTDNARDRDAKGRGKLWRGRQDLKVKHLPEVFADGT